MTDSVRKNIPKGKFRIIGVDLFDHEDYFVGDYDTQDEAFRIADSHNRRRAGMIADAYYVYDDQGKYLRGPEAFSSTPVISLLGKVFLREC